MHIMLLVVIRLFMYTDPLRCMKYIYLSLYFRDLLVRTAMEGVEESYRRQNQNVTLINDYHVLKGWLVIRIRHTFMFLSILTHVCTYHGFRCCL